MPMIRRAGRSGRLDERGVALPLALMGLVVVSLLVTTALLSSTTEMATSRASVDAARGLYQAEAAVDEYLTGIDQAGTSLDGALGAQTFSSVGGPVRLTTAQLGQVTFPDGGIQRTFSILSEPMRGTVVRGRAVIAMVQQNVPPPIPFATNINSAIALGGNLDVNGNAFTVSGRLSSGDTCAAQGVDAVQRSGDSEITANNSNHMSNFIGVDSLGGNTSGWNAITTLDDKSREQLAYEALGLQPGQTLQDLIDALPDNKKFGPSFGTATTAFDGRVDHTDKVAVVDAGGGFVELLGDSGVVIVVNGHLRMRGNASFRGIIIVEGNFNLAGTPRVDGAIVSLGIDETPEGNVINLDSEATLSGHVTVQFNKCSILAAEQAFRNASQGAARTTTTAPFAWFEVVR